MEDQSPGLDFAGQIRDLLRILREQWWIILLCLVLTTVATAVYTSTVEKEYEASAKLLLQPDNLGSTISGTGVVGTDPTRQANTDAQLAALPAVAARVTKKLKKPLSAAAIRTAANPDSNILTITVEDHIPQRAAQFANAFGRQFIVFRRETTRKRYRRALRTVQARLSRTPRGTPEYAGLRGRSKQLKLFVSLQTGDAELVQSAAAPRKAVRPNPTRNIALGAIVGLLLGLGLALVRDRLDRRIKNEEEMAALMPGVPVIGLIPEPRRGDASWLMTAEGFHTLHANLGMIGRGRRLKTLLVTSAMPKEGKSTVALNLALAMRESGMIPLLMDADLRRPALSERLNADRRRGVSRILAGRGSIEASVQERSVEPSRNGDGPSVALTGRLSLVAAGPPAPNVPLILNASSLGLLLQETRQREECVIFDGPPVGTFADMLPLAKEVDGVMVVVRLYHSRRDQIKRLAAQLASGAIEPIGVVVLGAAIAPSSYYSDYLAKR